MKILILLPLAVSFLAVAVLCLQDDAGVPPGDGARDSGAPAPAEGFQWAELARRATRQPGRYLEFLERDSLSTGLYRIPAGEQDQQQPHELDEVYYVVEGSARFEAGDETWEARPGAVLFVAAGVEHRFLDITEDLEVLVFFSKGPAQER